MQKNFYLLLCLLCVINAKAQSIQKSLDSLISKNFTAKEPGLGVLIVQKGKVVYQKAFGSANLELNVPMEPDMVFRIGSITKQFTAIGILQLVEQGKISLQDSVQQFIPDYPTKGYTITIEHLLTHTSGIRDFQTIDHPDIYIERHDIKPTEIIDHFKNTALEFPPGTKYNYSNSGYTLLAYIIEKVSGKTYHQYMKENVLDKAGLKNTSYAREKEIIAKRVTGYTRDPGYFENCYYQTTSIGYGCGDILSTLQDLYTWTKAVFTNKLVKKEWVQKAITPYQLSGGGKTNYGYGYLIDSLYNRPCVWHAGQVSGFISMEFYFPDEDVFVSQFTNVQSGEDTTSFSDSRFKLFFEIPFYAFNNKVGGEITLPEAGLQQYAGSYEMNGRSVNITLEKNNLYFNLGGQFKLHPLSPTRFFLTGIKDPVWIDFTNDKLSVYQKGTYEWKKTK